MYVIRQKISADKDGNDSGKLNLPYFGFNFTFYWNCDTAFPIKLKYTKKSTLSNISI